MQGVEQSVTSAQQVASSASSVGRGLSRPRVAGGTTPPDNSAPTVDSSSTITANDFLALLVAEMKNQDPTQPTDPNAYISQMVGVNSLQQLIGINQGVSSLDTATGATPRGLTNSPGGTN